jgi:hypothetical protein
MKTLFAQPVYGLSGKILPLIFIALFCSLFSKIIAQPIIAWDKTIGGSNVDEAKALSPTSDGGFIAAGTSYSGVGGDKSQAGRGNADYWVVKMRTDGTREWDKTFGGSGADYLVTVKQTSDGGYILAGWSQSDAGGDKTENDRGAAASTRGDYWLVKLNAAGVKQWDKTLGGTSNEILKSVIQTPDGGYIVGGISDSPAGSDKTNPRLGAANMEDYWIVKLAANGSKVWDKTLGTTDWDELGGLDLNQEGGYTLIGTNIGSGSSNRKWQIIKLNTAGGVESQKSLTRSNNGTISEIHRTADNGYIVGVKTEPLSLGYQAVKLDAAGNLVWERFFRGVNNQGSVNSDELTSTVQTPDGGYLLGGYTYSDAGRDKSEDGRGGGDYWLVKLAPDGSRQWDKTLGGGRQDVPYAVTTLADGGYVAAGYSFSGSENEKSENARGESDFWIVKLGPNVSKPVLSFSASQLNFTVTQGGSTQPKSLLLASIPGQPTVTLSKSANSNWLVLPTPGLGSLSFGINAAGLAPGVYTSEVTASAAGYTSAQFSVNLTVLSTSRGTTVRINAGGNAFTTADGRVFSADMYFGGVNRVHSIPSGDITGTVDDVLYRTERSSTGFTYNIPVTNGYYMVVLYFAEIWFGAPGGRPLGQRQRLFNIDLEGTRIFTEFNVLARAGAPMKMTREIFPVSIRDGIMNFNFSRGSADLPTLAAIEVMPLSEFSGAMELPVLADATVRDGSFANQNAGAAPLLDVKNGAEEGISRHTYLQFSTQAFNDIYEARLRIYGNNVEANASVNLSVYGVDNDAWTESGITWNNAPTATAAADGYVNVDNTLGFYEVDVTRYVRSQSATDRLVSLVLKNPTAKNRKLAFHSKENASGNAPTLIVVTREGFSDTYRKGPEEEIVAKAAPAEGSSVIFPNPVSGSFHINVSAGHHGKMSLATVSDLGYDIPIRFEKVATGTSQNEIRVTNQKLRAGLYMLKIQSESLTEVLKMVVVE